MKTLNEFLQESEVLDELKSSTLSNYIRKASSDAVKTASSGGMASAHDGVDSKRATKKRDKSWKRVSGISRAGSKLANRAIRGGQEDSTKKMGWEEEVVHEKVATGPRLGEPREKGATYPNAGEGEKIQKRTKKWMGKQDPPMKGAPGLDAMKAREAEHRAQNKSRNEEVVLEKDLNAAERRALPDSDFALPGKGKGPEGKQAGSYPIPDLTHARAALAMVAKYGTPEEKEKVRAAVKRKFPDIQQEGLVEPKGVDSAKEVNKATRKAAFRPFHKEDKALAYVIAKLKKQHGDNAVLTKGDKMPEPSAAQKKKNAEIRAQRAKEDHRDETEKATSGRYNDRSRSD